MCVEFYASRHGLIGIILGCFDVAFFPIWLEYQIAKQNAAYINNTDA